MKIFIHLVNEELPDRQGRKRSTSSCDVATFRSSKLAMQIAGYPK